jgi:peptidoglycan/LPS O-acetylase OafA/YrhL
LIYSRLKLMSTAKPEPVRQTVLDFVRGVAVALMIVSHGVYFFFSGQSALADGLVRGNIFLTISIFSLLTAEGFSPPEKIIVLGDTFR